MKPPRTSLNMKTNLAKTPRQNNHIDFLLLQ